MKLKGIHVKGVTLDKKTGKIKRTANVKQSVSQKIARNNKPKQTYRRGGR